MYNTNKGHKFKVWCLFLFSIFSQIKNLTIFRTGRFYSSYWLIWFYSVKKVWSVLYSWSNRLNWLVRFGQFENSVCSALKGLQLQAMCVLKVIKNLHVVHYCLRFMRWMGDSLIYSIWVSRIRVTCICNYLHNKWSVQMRDNYFLYLLPTCEYVTLYCVLISWSRFF